MRNLSSSLLFNIPVSLVVAYLLGSIPSAVWFSKLFAGIDIRDEGSKNAGLTNTFRVLGWKPALPVVFLDLGKGVLAPYIAIQLSEGSSASSWLPMAAGFVAILGHSFTCMAGFRGGKGVLTALGVFLCLAWFEALIAFVVWLTITLVTRYVSLASILACFALSISLGLSYFLNQNISNLLLLITGVLVTFFVTFKHKANIQRLLNGTENRFGSKKKEV